MKKIFTLLAAALVSVASASAETAILNFSDAQLSAVEVNGTTDADNCLTWDAYGITLVLQNPAKAYSGAKDITVNGERMKTIKLSNGAANVLTVPEGLFVNKITLYSYINYNRVDKGSEGRVCYWKQIGNNIYTKTIENEDGTTTTLPSDDAVILHDYSDVDGYQDTPDVVTVDFAEGLNSVTFTNTGEQLCFVIEVTYSDDAGIADINAENADAPVYNVLGQPVSSDYKGLVIKGGKKFIQR